MTYWNQRSAVLQLSATGREIFENSPSLEVFVLWADDLGLWVFQNQVNTETTSVRLIKWVHFESAVLDVIASEPEPPRVIGFRDRRTGK